MNLLIRLIKGTFLKFNYKRLHRKYDNFKMELDKKGVVDLRKKLDKLLSSLGPAQLVYLAHFDTDKSFGELAFYHLMNLDNDFRKSLMRQEVDALGAYYVKGFPYAAEDFTEEEQVHLTSIQEDGSKKTHDIRHTFAITREEWLALQKKYIAYCKAVYKREGKNDQVQN